LKINKRGQSFDIINRFQLQDEDGKVVPYCRVKFYQTGHEAVFKNSVIESLNFEDPSLKYENAPVVEVVEPTPEPEPEQESKTVLVMPVVEEVAEEVVEDKKPVIMAHSPKGEDIEVTDLEEFVAEHDLDMEAVESVLEGKQKTHKKWGFTRA